MKMIFSILLFTAVCFAQSARVPTVTRTVQQFGDLERKLAQSDSVARPQFLTEDFEERLCAAPGTPVPRDLWLQKVAISNVTFSQEAVHMYGDVAVYSGLRAGESDSPDMIVDTWKQADGGWKLAVRYRCPATGARPTESGPPKRF